MDLLICQVVFRKFLKFFPWNGGVYYTVSINRAEIFHERSVFYTDYIVFDVTFFRVPYNIPWAHFFIVLVWFFRLWQCLIVNFLLVFYTDLLGFGIVYGIFRGGVSIIYR